MKVRQLIRELVETRGAVVRTEHHIQIPSGNGMHDVWIGKEGLKWKLHGDRAIHSGAPERLLSALEQSVGRDTDLEWMRRLTPFLKRVEGKTGVWVDAGWKNGIATMAVVRIWTERNADIAIRTYVVENSIEAEEWVIDLAKELWPGEEIHTDCKEAAAATGATWVPREANRVADHFGNRRGK